ncbi:MAG: dicarboxylate/amino acid:cation symporter [Sphingomonadaceae bacterium]
MMKEALVENTHKTGSGEQTMVSIRLPVWWTFGALLAGLGLGGMLQGSIALERLLPAISLIGTLWLNALQMTIIPLVAALLVTGISRLAEAAQAGAAARRMLVWISVILVMSGAISALFMPLLLQVFPIPLSSSTMLMGDSAGQIPEVPGIDAFVQSLIVPNPVAAAAGNAMLPLTLFFAILALAIARLPPGQKATMQVFFLALANTMLIVIGWVMKLAPAGVFALALGVAAQAGSGAFATLLHYILTISAMGACVLAGAYLLAIFVGRIAPLRFIRAMLPAQAVAISTQSSLATLPAMLTSARQIGVSERTADFVLPLAVAVFRATSPAMNMAVAIYVASLAGVSLPAPLLIAGIAVAFIISIGSVSLPGSISFVVSIGPICLAMGVPIAPLALLVAVEMLPDIMRTLGNVTMDVALTRVVDQRRDVLS